MSKENWSLVSWVTSVVHGLFGGRIVLARKLIVFTVSFRGWRVFVGRVELLLV
jgi:hypothetical protein